MSARGNTAYRKSGRSPYAGSRARGYRYGYQYGTAAVAPEREERTRSNRRTRQEQREIARSAQAQNTRRQQSMNPALIVFLFGMIALMCVGLFGYISLQAAVTASVEEISSYESTLTSLKEANDETYNEILASVNLEDIKYRAIHDLGMTYAEEDQIISYEGDTNDYVHQSMEVAGQ